MKIIGQRSDGTLQVGIGDRLVVMLKGDRCSPAQDQSVVEKLGPWVNDVDNSFDARQLVLHRLDRARVAPLAFFHPVADSVRYRELWLSVKDRLDLKEETPAHPFTYCREHVVPKMEAEGKGPDDADAFCAWWKAENA